ncbi:GDP-mannose-dependent alpha-(1-6)-phosphatidylinositol dimannoside mannosyltransferase [Pirellulimonas nuda]|uniref:GDP-mannose-dependent alpha-(1-6)-phosphatidylinositol dimannoside mannosyltransferase n=1 Tax=Pirellulimonas nuda TaxID=2528009 RepID=A0A518D7S9_9BACT|nr:glycosyltransferase [Pirellulimonas nuda]QDU87505.1 GDP-mannose-dependent alpha-(1-6)-phosphatidylinositol dimannoside mannosyltransferase [Pirellulimonas nuda]
MRLCDITLSYTETSGGIRTYIDAKRKFLRSETEHDHVLIIPGETDECASDGRNTTYTVASPILPGCEPYRFFLRPDKIRDALAESLPDVIELGSFYVAPWAAFRHQRDRAEIGSRPLVSGYFHTDIAEAYVGGPLRNAFHGWSRAVEWVGDKLADAAERGAEAYVGSAFEQCDIRLAASEAQAGRLREYGVEEVRVLPLGVDLDVFSPEKRSEERAALLGVDDHTLVLIFTGRLDVEKQVHLLVDALEMLPAGFDAALVLMGEGPLREELEVRSKRDARLIVLPYESDRGRLARVLASADIYVTAGPHETFGLSVVEAQACGLPVVGVAGGALVERVPEGLGLLGPVGDARAMADNILRVADQRRAMGARARRHVETRFGWDTTCRKLLQIYEQAFQDA